MTDSVAVFDPGFRVTDNSTGAPVSGAVLEFYDAETSNPKTVYSDKDLLEELGTSVTCDSLGYPTSDGSTKTRVYVGTAAFKVVAKTSGGTTLWTHDNNPGAVEITTPDDLSVVSETPVVTKSLDYTVLDADQSTVFVGNCSSADVTFTLPSAVTVGDGWFIDIQHAGSANQVLIASVSSQTISSGATSYSTVMVLSRSGESVRLVSDGGNWRVTAHSPPHIKHAQGIITVTDRLTAPPGSEVNGAIYLISGSPSGDWSSYSAGDLVQYTSSAWVRFVPQEGWQVWVADEDIVYTCTGSNTWISASASDSQAGIVEYAVQSEMEAASSNVLAVTPGRVHFHPAVAKFWAYVTVSGGTPSVAGSYNVTSITDNGDGDLIVTIATDFADTNWAVFALARAASTNTARICYEQASSHAAGTTNIICENLSGTKSDPAAYSIMGFGDHA
jgi:hypothetical protein